MAVEISGHSLQIIESLDKRWVENFKAQLRLNNCELIGSGYVQVIGPLVPSEVNEYNQEFGLETYKKILDFRPRVAFVNEQAYSSGLILHYKKAGYKAIVME